MPDPTFEFSVVGSRLAAGGGILALMDEMGRALALDPQMRMLGGGNPAVVPAMQALVCERMAELLADADAFTRMIVNYDPPRGNPRFLQTLADLLRRQYGWDIGPDNLAVTNGGQSAFFFLFNLLAGACAGGRHRKVLLPLMPEYIGYADQGLDPDIFRRSPITMSASSPSRGRPIQRATCSPTRRSRPFPGSPPTAVCRW